MSKGTREDSVEHMFNTLRRFPELHQSLQSVSAAVPVATTRPVPSKANHASSGKLTESNRRQSSPTSPNRPIGRKYSKQIYTKSRNLDMLKRSSFSHITPVKDIAKALHEERMKRKLLKSLPSARLSTLEARSPSDPNPMALRTSLDATQSVLLKLRIAGVCDLNELSDVRSASGLAQVLGVNRYGQTSPDQLKEKLAVVLNIRVSKDELAVLHQAMYETE